MTEYADRPGTVAGLPGRSIKLAVAALLLFLIVVAALAAVTLSSGRETTFAGSSWSYEKKGQRLTVSQAQAIRIGTTRSDLLALLGPPAGRGVQRMNGERDLRCLVYRDVRTYASRVGHNAFCFRDGRLAALRLW